MIHEPASRELWMIGESNWRILQNTTSDKRSFLKTLHYCYHNYDFAQKDFLSIHWILTKSNSGRVTQNIPGQVMMGISLLSER